jgi:hypothetical protein
MMPFRRRSPRTRKTLRNIKAVDVVSVGRRCDNLDAWRAHVRLGILVEGVD